MRALKKRSRALRGRKSATDTHLPRIAWSEVLPRNPIRLVETDKRNGNVNLSEVAILAQAAADVQPGHEIVEIGTFDGRTALNLAVNARRDVGVTTLDLPAKHPTAWAIEASERQYVDKRESGKRIRSCCPPWRAYADRITQVFGDSATFDWSKLYGRAGLVFVDGSHAYDYVRKDSETALRLVCLGGVVFWHDYGVWEGVTRALEELEARRKLGLRHIRGTSLVYLRCSAALDYMADAPAGQDDEDELSLAPTEAPVVHDLPAETPGDGDLKVPK